MRAQATAVTILIILHNNNISKEVVGNFWDILNAILGHKSSESSSHIKQIKSTFATKGEFYHVCVLHQLQYAYVPLTFDLALASE